MTKKLRTFCLSICLIGSALFASAADGDKAFHDLAAEAARQAQDLSQGVGEKLDQPVVEADEFSVQTFGERVGIQAALKALEGKEHDGGGVRVVVVYTAFGVPRAGASMEAQFAKDKGWAINTYTGIMSRVFESKAGELCFRMYVLEREGADGKPAVRTFNTVRGNVKQLIILTPKLPNT